MGWPLLDLYKRSLRDTMRTVFRVEAEDGDLRFIPIEKIVDVHYGVSMFTVPDDYYPREGLVMMFLRDYTGRKTFVRYERGEEGFLEEVELGSSLLDLADAGIDLGKLLETMTFVVEEKTLTEYTNTGMDIPLVPLVHISLPYSVVLAHPDEYRFSYMNESMHEGEAEICLLQEPSTEMQQRLRDARYPLPNLDRNAFLAQLREHLDRAGGGPYRVKVFWKTESSKQTVDNLIPAFRDFLERLGVSTLSTKHAFNVTKVKRNRRLEFDITPVES